MTTTSIVKFGPFTTYAPPGVYVRTLISPNVASITGSIRIPVFIGTGEETLTITNLEVIRGSSSFADNPIIGEDVSSQFDGTNQIFTVSNYPIVTGEGSGTVSFDPRTISVTIDGDPVTVYQVLGDIGRVTLDLIPAEESIVRIDYFFKRTDTKVTNEDHTVETDGTNASFKVYHRPIVNGGGGGVTTTNVQDVTVKVDGSTVVPTSVDGLNGIVVLPTAPDAGAEVLITYYFNMYQSTFDYLPHGDITEVGRVGNAPNRQDYIEFTDFKIVDNTIVWGAAAIVKAGVHTVNTEFLDTSQISAQLVDNRYFLVEASGTADAANKTFTLISTPTDGSGRQLSSEDVTKVNAYVGKTATLAFAAGEVDVTSLNADLRTIKLKEAPLAASQGSLTSGIIPARLNSIVAPNSQGVSAAPTFTIGISFARLVSTTAGPFNIQTGTNDTFTVTFDDQFGGAPAVARTVVLTAGAARTAAQIAAEINADIDTFWNTGTPHNFATVIDAATIVLTSFDATGNSPPPAGSDKGPGAAGTASTIAITGNSATVLGFVTPNNTATGTADSTQFIVDITDFAVSPTPYHYVVTLSTGQQNAETLAAAINAVIVAKGEAVAVKNLVADTFTSIVRVTAKGNGADKYLALSGAGATRLGFTGGNASSRSGGAESFYVLTGTNDTVSITADGGATQAVILTAGANTAEDVVDSINAIICPSISNCPAKAETVDLGSGLTGIKIYSASFGTTSSIQLSGTALRLLGFEAPNNADTGTDQDNVYVTYYTNLISSNTFTVINMLAGASGIGKYKVQESNFSSFLGKPTLDLAASRVGAPNFSITNVVWPYNFPDMQTIPNKAVAETVTITFTGASPSRTYLVTSSVAGGTTGTGELNQTYIDAITGFRFTLFDADSGQTTLPDDRSTGSTIINPYDFTGSPTFARLVGSLNGPFTIITGVNDDVDITFDSGEASETVIPTITLTAGSRTAAQVATELNAAIDTEVGGTNNAVSVVANRLVISGFDVVAGPQGPGTVSKVTVVGSATSAKDTIGFSAGNDFSVGANSDYLVITVQHAGEFLTSTTPNIQIPGLWVTVNNTLNVGTNDTATIRTFQKAGREPSVSSFYYITYKHTKDDFDVKLFSRFADVENEFGTLSPTNKLTLAAYLAFLNGSQLIALKQIVKEPGGTDASRQDYIDAVKSFERPLPGGYMPDLIIPLTTDGTVQSVLLDHVIKMSSERYQGERMAIAGFPLGTLPEAAAEIAKAFKSREFIFVYPDYAIMGLNNELGELEEFVIDGAILPAAYAGLDCSPVFDVATPMTRKQIVGLRRLGRRLDAVEMNQTASSGVTVLEEQTPNIRVRHAITTDFTNVLTRESNVTKISHFVQRVMRANLDQYIGSKFLKGLEADIEATTRAVMRALVDAEIVKEFTGIRAEVDDTDPTQANVTVYYVPIFAVNYIRVSFSLRTRL